MCVRLAFVGVSEYKGEERSRLFECVGPVGVEGLDVPRSKPSELC